ncbi:D-Ala-D-Ala carboxypeptidase family metallohydrolase [Acuticoccus sediminis]|uniref:D-Ala-D-Ala carboxypeptidase family metallohydrolase n=1 Tax=Acuticoccus sediminis TaxID=2184697 RepID=UPI001CFCB7EC|nr:D-Ala-D-Ala carboxypeptidase family metallohydrolase [Acuticoccus sediminis]
MATDDERLAILIEGRVADFEKALKSVERKVDKMGKGVNDNMRGVERSSRRAANTMEREFAQATTGIAGKLRVLRTMTGDARSLLGGAFGALSSIGPATGVFGAVGGFAAGAAVSKINDTAKAIADLNAEAERAGLSFEAFQELDFAFDKERVSIDALTDGIKELQLRADEFAVTGKGSAAEAFTRLGYGAEELKRKLKDPQDLLLDIIGRLEKFDKAAQIRIADEVFGGTGGEQFVQLLDAGEGKIRANIQRARDLGIVLSSDVARRAQEVNEKFEELSRVISKRVKSGVVDLGEAIASVGEEIYKWVPAADKFIKSLDEAKAKNKELEESVARALGTNASPTATPYGDAADSAEELAANADKGARSFEEQQDIVERLERGLERVAAQAALEESKGAIANFERLQETATRIGAKLEDARRTLFAMAGVQFNLSDNAPPGIGPTGSPGAVSSEGVRPGVDVGSMTAAARAGALEVARDFGLTISSGYRSPSHNARVGGASHSRHMQGDAVDLTGVTADNVAAIVGALQSRGFRGFGYYNNGSLHADMGQRRAWGPDRTSGSLGQTPYAFQQAVMYGPSMDQIPSDRKLALSEAAYKSEQDLAKRDQVSRAKQAEDAQKQAEALQRVNEELARELEIENQRAELQAAGFSQEQINNALDEEALVREKLNQLKAAGIEVDAQQEEKIRALVSQLFELRDATDQAAAAQQKLEQAQQDVGAAAQAIGQPILDTLLSLGDGAEDVGEKFKQLAKQIANMVLQGALFGQGPLGNLFGGGLLGGLLGRASGGPVRAGQPYMVGEQGKELFVPGANGTMLDASRTKSMMDRMMTPSMAGGSASAPGSGIEKLVIEIASRFDADGGFDSAVERTAGPIARAESRKASDRVARSVSSISDARSHDKETRKTRTLRGWGVPD